MVVGPLDPSRESQNHLGLLRFGWSGKRSIAVTIERVALKKASPLAFIRFSSTDLFWGRGEISKDIKKDLFPQRPLFELEPLPRGFVLQIPSKERFAYCNTSVTACKGLFASICCFLLLSRVVGHQKTFHSLHAIVKPCFA